MINARSMQLIYIFFERQIYSTPTLLLVLHLRPSRDLNPEPYEHFHCFVLFPFKIHSLDPHLSNHYICLIFIQVFLHSYLC